MQENSKSNATDPRPVLVITNQDRKEKMKEIDKLYRSQIRQKYWQSPDSKPTNVLDKQLNSKFLAPTSAMTPISPGALKSEDNSRSSTFMGLETGLPRQNSEHVRSQDNNLNASLILRGQSTRTFQHLRRQNEVKQLKIRELSGKCESLLDKLKAHLTPKEYQTQLQTLRDLSQGKTQRMQNLLKIKNEEIFFKVKLQIVGLLQQFQVSKEQLNQANDIATDSSLFAFMGRKLKLKLKDFKCKEQQCSFEMQKDKILGQKYEERIHYLTETNELLKLSESKLKQKVEDLKVQLKDFLDKLQAKEKQLQNYQSDLFKLKKQHQELQSVHGKLLQSKRTLESQREDQKRTFQAKQKQMKALMANYFLQKKKLISELQQREGYIQQLQIKWRFTQQQNQRLDRQYLRWKQRYQWMQREKQAKQLQSEEELNVLVGQFEAYKVKHNDAIIINYQAEIDQLVKRVSEYQMVYQELWEKFQEERKAAQRAEGEFLDRIKQMENQWNKQLRSFEEKKKEQLKQLLSQSQNNERQQRLNYQKREKLLVEEMQAKMNTVLAQRCKQATNKAIQSTRENDELRRELNNLYRVLQVKQSLISVMNNKKTYVSD